MSGFNKNKLIFFGLYQYVFHALDDKKDRKKYLKKLQNCFDWDSMSHMNIGPFAVLKMGIFATKTMMVRIYSITVSNLPWKYLHELCGQIYFILRAQTTINSITFVNGMTMTTTTKTAAAIEHFVENARDIIGMEHDLTHNLCRNWFNSNATNENIYIYFAFFFFISQFR